jgi:hypothetical protein
MRYQLLVGISLLILAGFFVTLELLVRPEVLTATKDPATLKTDDQNTTITIEPLPTKDTEDEEELPTVDTGYFFPNITQLKARDITLEEGHRTGSLFHHVAFDPDNDPFITHTWQILLNGERIGTVSHITTKNTISVPTAFLQLQRFMQDAITQQNNPQISVSELYTTRGEANFYLNDPVDFPKTVFMLVRNGEKILAFSYAKKYHEPQCEASPSASTDNPSAQDCQGGEMKALLPLFF